MSIGLTDENGDYNVKKYPARHHQKWKPATADYIVEIRQRKAIFREKVKTNSQMN